MAANVAKAIPYRRVRAPGPTGQPLGQGARPAGCIDSSEWIAVRDQLHSRGLDGSWIEGGPRHLRERLAARRAQEYEALLRAMAEAKGRS